MPDNYEIFLKQTEKYLSPPLNEPERQYYYMGLLRKYAEGCKKSPLFFIQTFGCQMNERDSEKMAGILMAGGFEPSPTEEEADLILYNTCTVRENADKRILGRLGVLKGYKEQKPSLLICLAGCLTQEKTVIEKIRNSYPYVDIVFGTYNIHKFAELLWERINSGAPVIDVWDREGGIVEALPKSRKYKFKSGVNIMFGCNNFCSYCIVPYVRGRERSRRPSEIIDEMRDLAADGVKEVMLLGQNVNSYGRGLDEEITFPELLRMAEQIEGIERIRFMSSHPKDLSDDLIKVMADSKKICRHLHLAVQSGSDRVLKLMNRHYTAEDYLRIIDKLKTACPDIAVTTDIIVGFPGEEMKDIEDTISLINRAEFDGAFTFIYSKRTGTAASEYKQLLTEEEIHYGFDRVLSAVQENAKRRIKRFVGEKVKVLTECVNEKDPSYLSGRLSQNTIVHFKGPESLIGEITEVTLTNECGFYYMGEMQQQ